MVAQKKGGAGKQKGTKVTPGRALPVKMFESKFDDDDDDEDMATGSDSGSDSNEAPVKKQQAAKGPKKADMHVSFQLSGSTPPPPNSTQKNQMQKARTPTPMVPKKQQAQMLREQCLKKGMVGSPTLKAFEGMKGTPSDKAQKGKKRKSEDDDDDDDDEDDDDFEDDDDDIDLDDEDDDSDKEDVDDDEDDDEDDDDLDSDEEEDIVEKAKALMAAKKNQKTPVKQNDSAKKANEPPSAKKQNQSQVKKEPNTQTPKKQQKNQATKEDAKTPQGDSKSPEKLTGVNKIAVSMDDQARQARDAKTLFARHFPFGTSAEEIKTLSPDILTVRFPSRFKKEGKGKGMYVFLEFASEAKAEENYKLLQKKKFRGESIMVDFAGVKSKSGNISASYPSRNLKKLFVEGMTGDTTIADVAKIFPKAYWIMISEGSEIRTASILFSQDEWAAEAMKKNANATINGRSVTVMYAVEGKKKQKKKPRKPRNKTAKQPQLKKPKLEEPVSSDDDDDDEDDD